MKKIFLCLMAMATLALVGCGNKGNDPEKPEEPEGTKVTINVSKTTDLSISVNVEISDSAAYYCCSIIPSSVIAGYTDDSLMVALTAKITKYLSQYTPEYLVKNGVLFQGNKEELTGSGLTPATDYTVVVVTYDVTKKAPIKAFKATASTKAAIDHFQCTCDSAAYVSINDSIVPVVYFTITPDDNKMYYVPAFAMKASITGDVTTYFNSYLNYINQTGQIGNVVKAGKKSIGVNYAGTDIKTGDEVSVVIAGINTNVQLVTSVQRFDFKVSFPQLAPTRRAPEAKVAGKIEVPFGTPMVAL